MTKIVRRVIEIDREKCNGCGKCVTACHEGAIQLVNGKAELVSDTYCDGLGDCIGDCPVDAIKFVEREADPYDEAAVKARLAAQGRPHNAPHQGCPGSMARSLNHPAGGCPGSAARNLSGTAAVDTAEAEPAVSRLANWPLQIRLVPESAPYLAGAELVLAADCVAFATPNFQQRFLRGDGKVCLIGCPKLDDSEFYVEKLARIIEANKPSGIRVVRMEVPCCGGMTRIAQEAVKRAGSDLTVNISIVTLNGNVIE